MSLLTSNGETELVSFPRVSGDEPVAKAVPLPKDAFSPRERG